MGHCFGYFGGSAKPKLRGRESGYDRCFVAVSYKPLVRGPYQLSKGSEARGPALLVACSFMLVFRRRAMLGDHGIISRLLLAAGPWIRL